MTSPVLLASHPAPVVIRAGAVPLWGTLIEPVFARGTVIFAHGSSHISPLSASIASRLKEAGFATLLLDLQTESEARGSYARVDIPLLAERLEAAIAWIRNHPSLGDLPLGIFGVGIGAAAAIAAAAGTRPGISGVISCSGRLDLAGEAVMAVTVPVLLIVGALDLPTVQVNRSILRVLPGPAELVVVPGAGHLFVEPGGLEEVGRLTAYWCDRFLHR